jgi:uncharacterized membrane protein YcaP (DUF421 family)
MDWQELAYTAARATVIYMFLLVVIRLLGKRTVGHSTAFDFMVALILGEVVDEPIYGDVPFAQGLVVIAVIAAWHWTNSWLSYRSRGIDWLTGGQPRVVVKDGTVDRGAMAKELLNEAELWSLLREQGIERLEDVKTATLEPGGKLSVLRTEHAREIRKADLRDLRDRVA